MKSILNKLKDLIKPLMDPRAVSHTLLSASIDRNTIYLIYIKCFQMWDSNANKVKA